MQEIDSALLAKFDKLQADTYTDENITVYDSTGREIYTNNDTIYYKTSKAYFDTIMNQNIVRYAERGHNIIAFNYFSKGKRYFVSAGAIPTTRNTYLYDLRVILIVTFFVSLLVVIIIGYIFVTISMQPIAIVIDSVKSLSPVEKSERLPRHTERDEIAELIDTFNELFDKLEDSFRLQKHFATNVSHEFNNPLTKIKTQLEVSLMQHRSEDEYRQMMQSLLEDVNELSNLITDLMQFSMITQGILPPHHTFRIDEMLFELRDRKIERHPDYQIHIQLINPPEDESQMLYSGNKSLISTAVKNIIDNACKYSTDKTANISLSFTDDIPVLSIQNNGEGISSEDIPHIFEAFYRSPAVGYTQGFGIGLALAQRICKAYNIGIRIESSMATGSTFYLTFLSKI